MIAGLESVFAPVMIVGIQLPIAALIASIFAVILTAYLSVYRAGWCCPEPPTSGGAIPIIPYRPAALGATHGHAKLAA